MAIPGTAIVASDLAIEGFRFHGVPLLAEDDGSTDAMPETVDPITIALGKIALAMEEFIISAFTEALSQLTAGVVRKASPGVVKA